MKKIIKKLGNDNGDIDYFTYQIYCNCNFALYNLWLFLKFYGNNDPREIYFYNGMNVDWLHLDKIENDMVCLWSSWSIKQQATIQGLTPEEQQNFDDAYWNYYHKRFDDMPKVEMSIQNYAEIVQKWQDLVLTQKYPYMILSQDDNGYVDLVGKDELSPDDLDYIKFEHEKYLQYDIAYKKYMLTRYDTDELWYGPESSEFEADWKKHLDENWKDKF